MIFIGFASPIGSKAKVADQDVAGISEEQITWLQIAMDHSLTVNVLESEQAFCKPQAELVLVESISLQHQIPSLDLVWTEKAIEGCTNEESAGQVVVRPHLLLL